MTVTYIVRPRVNELICEEHSIVSDDLGYVGILGHKKYVCDVEGEVAQAVWSRTAMPLGITAPIGDDYKFSNIVKSYITVRTGHKSVDTVIVKYVGFVVIYPLVRGDYIYVDDSESTMFSIDTLDYVDYELLTTHPMGYHACLEECTMFGVRNIGGLFVYTSEMKDYVSEAEISNRISRIRSKTSRYDSQGTVLVKKGSDLFIALISELTHVWLIPRRESPDGLIFISEGSSLPRMYSGAFKDWITDSICRLMLDLPPTIRVIRPDVVDLEDRDKALLLMEYMCVRSLRVSCTVGYDKCLGELVVLPSTEALVPMWGPDEYKLFMDTIEGIKLEDIHIHQLADDSEHSAVERANSKFHGIVLRNSLISMSENVIAATETGKDESVGVDHLFDIPTHWGKYLYAKHQISSELPSGIR